MSDVSASEDFVERYYEDVFVASQADALDVLQHGLEANGGRAWTQELSAWYVSLTPELQAQVARVIHLATEAACFTTLAVLDGSAALYDGDVELRLTRDGVDLTSEPLHPTLRAIVDENDPALLRRADPR